MYIHKEIIHNKNSATEILPLIFELFQPKSIIDVGCGTGTWLKVADELGVGEILGVDGDYVELSRLHIPQEFFQSHNLDNPLSISRKFDLVLCLEVAEHLSGENAERFVQDLTKLGNVILFSAAIPNQGGQGHKNEQWPCYWQEKFAKRGFLFYDEIRPKVWNNGKVDWWYRQNLFLVARDDNKLNLTPVSTPMPLIHPDLYAAKINIIRSFKHKYKLRDWEFDQVDFKPLNLKEALKILRVTIKELIVLKR